MSVRTKSSQLIVRKARTVSFVNWGLGLESAGSEMPETIVVIMLAPKMVTVRTKARRPSKPLVTAWPLPVSSSPLLLCRRDLLQAGRGRFWSYDDMCNFLEAVMEADAKRVHSFFYSLRNKGSHSSPQGLRKVRSRYLLLVTWVPAHTVHWAYLPCSEKCEYLLHPTSKLIALDILFLMNANLTLSVNCMCRRFLVIRYPFVQ